MLITLVICGFAAQRPGATFLLIPPTANATGMAYAYTAVSDDASVNYYNAAGLAFLTAPKITANYFGYLTGLYPDMYYVYCGLAYPLSKSSWGFDIIYFTVAKAEVYIPEIHNVTIWRLALKINYARKLNNRFSVGVGWKFIRQKYGRPDSWGWPRDETGFSWAFDFNGLYKILPNFLLGTVLHNIGPNIRYSDAGASDPLPRLFRLGIAYKPIENKYVSCTVSAEMTKVLVGMFAREENSFWENLKYEFKEAWKGIGLELTFYKIISLRSGYFYDMEGARKGFTFGGGINIKNFELDIGIDESIYDFPTENRKISLSYTF